MLTTPTHRTSWFFKFLEFVLATLAIFNTLSIVFEILPEKYLTGIPESFFDYFYPGQIAISLLIAIGYSIYWHKKEKAGVSNSGKIHAIARGIIRYWLASQICTYGFAKILGTQFHTPDYRLDMALGEVNGFGLTWYYYGYSYTLAVIIASVQIGGSILLLFRKTTLLGAFILLPVMVNILLINVFFTIASGAFLNSILFTLALLLLIAIEQQKIRAFLQSITDDLPPIKLGLFKYILRFLMVGCAFGLIYYFVVADAADKRLLGTWQIQTLIKNNDTIAANAWQVDSTAWTKVYIEGRYGIALSPNPYIYIPEKSKKGSYTYDTTAHTLVASFPVKDKQVDTLKAVVSNLTKKTMTLKGTLAKDSIKMVLTRIERKPHN